MAFYSGKTDIREVYERTEGAYGKTARQRQGIYIDLMDIVDRVRQYKDYEYPPILDYLAYEEEMKPKPVYYGRGIYEINPNCPLRL